MNVYNRLPVKLHSKYTNTQDALAGLSKLRVLDENKKSAVRTFVNQTRQAKHRDTRTITDYITLQHVQLSFLTAVI